MYGHKARRCRTYEYGLQVPTAGMDAAVEEMHRRLTLWNALVEVEHRYREAVEVVLGERPWAEALADPVSASHLDGCEAARRVAEAAAKRAAGLYWCNADEVVDAYRKARRIKKGAPPPSLHFHRWAGSTGKLQVRYQHGLAVDALSAGDTRLTVTPTGARGKRQYGVVRIRASRETWLEAPIILHRPLPAGLIRSAAVLRTPVGTHASWRLVIVVELPDGAGPAPTGTGAVGIDLGWRRVPSGLRAAAWSDDRGESGEVVLPQDWIEQHQKTEDIRSIRDQHFNITRASLARWLSTAVAVVPEWLGDATSTLPQWRAPGRLAALTLRWRENRFPGDDVAYAAAETWRKRDKHLLEYEANLRDQLLRRRRELYRVFAAGVAARYARVRLEVFDIRDVAELPETGTGDALPLPVRHNRVLAAPHILRLAVLNACGRTGVTVESVSAVNTTHICHVCGSLERFDAAEHLSHRCGACGVAWDQDYNAARNLLVGVAQA